MWPHERREPGKSISSLHSAELQFSEQASLHSWPHVRRLLQRLVQSFLVSLLPHSVSTSCPHPGIFFLTCCLSNRNSSVFDRNILNDPENLPTTKRCQRILGFETPARYFHFVTARKLTYQFVATLHFEAFFKWIGALYLDRVTATKTLLAHFVARNINCRALC